MLVMTVDSTLPALSYKSCFIMNGVTGVDLSQLDHSHYNLLKMLVSDTAFLRFVSLVSLVLGTASFVESGVFESFVSKDQAWAACLVGCEEPFGVKLAQSDLTVLRWCVHHLACLNIYRCYENYVR